MSSATDKPSEEGPMLYSSTSEDGKTPASIITIGAAFSALAAVAIVLRFYVRLRITRNGVGSDDWLMLAAFFLTLGMGTMLIVGGAIRALAQPTPQGWGPTDYFWITDSAEIITEKIFWAFIMVQDISFGLAKLSVLFFYRRIFSTRTFKLVNTCLMATVVVWSISFFVAYLFRCGTNFWALWAPLQYLLDYCYDSTPMFYTLAITDVVTDVLILSLPFFWIWRLKMTPGKKLGVSGVFLLGSIEIATGIVRLVVYTQQTSNYVETADGIGILTTMMFWSMIEMGVAVVAGCLPAIWPLVSNASLEGMLRTVRNVLSLESLRGSLSKGATRAKSKSDGPSRWPSEDVESYAYSDSTEGQHRLNVGSKGVIGVDRSVEVRRHLACEQLTEEGIPMNNHGVRNVTQVYTGRYMGDSA